jgi:hypothetical protein
MFKTNESCDFELCTYYKTNKCVAPESVKQSCKYCNRMKMILYYINSATNSLNSLQASFKD